MVSNPEWQVLPPADLGKTEGHILQIGGRETALISFTYEDGAQREQVHTAFRRGR